ncbi:hypothetical protein Pint_12405 [Pistacia integerrima]|uniref:Uncharacterized protein n=1 Tax=Pistacia integerrima TaxID=434235 RepID=A0ACC0Y6B5_9ROSI|nr:hypothetical protein Pint_12405 [Pistacia integerrima]
MSVSLLGFFPTQPPCCLLTSSLLSDNYQFNLSLTSHIYIYFTTPNQELHSLYANSLPSNSFAFLLFLILLIDQPIIIFFCFFFDMAMELQLGLALPTYNPTKGFDLNNFGKSNITKNKRNFDEAFGNIRDDHQSGMMPLLLWSGQPNEEDDQKKRTSSPINENEEEEKLVVGWPPIPSWRRKLLHHHHHQQQQQEGQMEGVAIARKIDLKLYHCFYTLTNSLIAKFAKYGKCNKRGVRYTLTYQDKGGDWLLAGDVPWQTFMESVQRLEIVKSGVVGSSI